MQSWSAAAQDGSTVGTAVHDVLGAAAAEGQQGQHAAAQEAQRERRKPRAEARLLSGHRVFTSDIDTARE